MEKRSTIDISEVEKFSKIADEWWNPNGKFKPLHKLNPVRLEYIIQKICSHYNRNFGSAKALEGIKILDIGCGGGLLSIPLSRLGAEVTGLDASEKNIKTATAYAKNNNIEGIKFINTTAEELAEAKDKFDVVLNMEVIEHVANVDLFMEKSTELLKKNGLMFVATLNRTAKSYLLGIIGAEYIMHWLPKGTHEWKKFLKPYEINQQFEKNKIQFVDSIGLSYNPFSDIFKLSDDLSMNFIMVGRK